MTTSTIQAPTLWDTDRRNKAERINAVSSLVTGKFIPTEKITEALELLIQPGDRVALEGNNQKQADFLSRSLARVNPERIHDLHMLFPSISRPEHLDLFEDGIASKVDFAFSGQQSARTAQLVEDGTMQVGAIHTYLELYSRMFLDLAPRVSLVAAVSADKDGNLFTGPNTEDTPTISEATAYRSGIVIAQVNEIVDSLPRVDIPGSWVDFVVEADKPFEVEALFTRDPRQLTDVHVLLAMLTIRGVYEKHQVTSLNHGVGLDTAAIELLLPTYAERYGLKGKICTHWALNPHPNLIPAIETGWVQRISAFGGEVGMSDYVAARPDIFATGPDGSLRSNRMAAQSAGLYATDMFVGSTLQIDPYGNSSTVTAGRLAGFGGAPNLGSDPRGRRHSSPAWLDMAQGEGQLGIQRGQKLVVQIAETFNAGSDPKFVEQLDAVAVGKKAGMEIAPVMIYGDDVTHLVSEEGVAYLYKAQSLEERRLAVSAISGVSPLGGIANADDIAELRRNGLVGFPEDIGVNPSEASRTLLAAHSMESLVEWSGGLYEPPAKFKSR
ncbi:malonate decarboxylase subunit alpha [Corynebacterium glutamicum MT]|uniref:Malonate decarboxylase subunit alpha n=2 Tax=Corynebacterium glutamicum TaxID=1718 RepID=A0AB36II65_CORGT|nr:malonate decarboxylase subunit alpha [Corynebacterium glutamicum]AGN17937.1 malonate decarboxylase subunit alpha [Corynebacterium glutamicum SCgG1]AGN20960.1 malonate decarboxylase subunit alpha [Corynebacterium glutamicum SCgG2]EGV40866.1 malonate decarboxylase, alpha subunit [Corynebacterium glutamicum S9114]EOA64860.1 malonate decarboxylase subunit alpha [Corynebacterium glutamicum MT]EPP41925.1 malonate decarboxylase subunit alpha [Corynebacterium glutamicum Z188]